MKEEVVLLKYRKVIKMNGIRNNRFVTICEDLGISPETHPNICEICKNEICFDQCQCGGEVSCSDEGHCGGQNCHDKVNNAPAVIASKIFSGELVSPCGVNNCNSCTLHV